MPLMKNMNIGLHPAIARKDIFVTSCDNYLIGSDGVAERLHRTPRDIFEIN
jgi:hypothetical protein